MKHKYVTGGALIPQKKWAAPRITSRHLHLRSFGNVSYRTDGEDDDKPKTGLTKQQYQDLVETFGKDAAKKMKELSENLTKELNDRWSEVVKGAMTTEDFSKFKTDELQKLNDEIAKQEKIMKEQGKKITELEAGKEQTEKQITLEDWFKTKMDDILKVKTAGSGFIEVTSEDLRKAGVVSFNGPVGKVAGNTTIGTSVQALAGAPANPYMPGLGGSDLELFDIVRNPNFILNRVDVGRTNQSRLAWINEVDYQGVPDANVLEGGLKPLTQHIFNVEFSTAKKAAAYVVLSEEFDQDLPGLSTAVRRMLQNDVLRTFDDAIQLAVIAIAKPYNISGLDAKVPFTTLFDACGALLAQVGFNNYVPNTLALNTVTSWQMLMDKDAGGRYLNPPFMDRLNRLLVEANKVAVGFGLAGDLSQYKVDIYKDFTLRIGWINDNLIRNLFCVVGELRYHNYISSARTAAIVYNSLLAVQQKITAGS